MRNKIITNLINLNSPIENIKKQLGILDWDSDEEIIMTKKSVESILNRYINNEIDNNTLVDWANLIESREDIGFEDPYFEKIKEVIFIIANPDLESKFNKERAKEWLSKQRLQ